MFSEQPLARTYTVDMIFTHNQHYWEWLYYFLLLVNLFHILVAHIIYIEKLYCKIRDLILKLIFRSTIDILTRIIAEWRLKFLLGRSPRKIVQNLGILLTQNYMNKRKMKWAIISNNVAIVNSPKWAISCMRWPLVCYSLHRQSSSCGWGTLLQAQAKMATS